MNRRRRTVAVIISSVATVSFYVHHLIKRQNNDYAKHSDSNSYNNFLKYNSEKSYISVTFTNPLIEPVYHKISHYIKQAHSSNAHIREHGLSQLAKLNISPIYYSIIGQQLDNRSLIQLARTCEANSNLFPLGLPYIFSIGNKRILSTDIKNVNDDDILLYTIKEFLEKLIDDSKRPLDTLSRHYRELLRSYLNEIHSQTVFDMGQHFEPEHADMSSKGIKRYRSNLELYSKFLYVLRGYADRYPRDVVNLNGLQILRYLYEKRKDNISFVRYIGKILVLLSRDQNTHDAFCAVGWLRILHDMALDENNIVFSLVASTILANLDRPMNERLISSLNEEKQFTSTSVSIVHSLPEISLNESTEIEEKRKEKQSNTKKIAFIDKFLSRIWYSRPDTNEYKANSKIEKTSKNDNKIIEENLVNLSIPWINDQVYGDKIILFSPSMYNVKQIDPDVRWHQEPIVDVVFVHGIAGSAFKTWRQENLTDQMKSTKTNEAKSLLKIIEFPEIDEETDEVLDIGEETQWNESTTTTSQRIDSFNEDESSACWPKDWLSKDVPTSHVRMLAIDYESRVSEWQIESLPKNILRRSMHDRAQELAEQLKQAGVGKRPIIWVAHSMGGLLAKYMLTNPNNQDLTSNTRACVFFSVPHFGAELASFGIRHAFFVRPTVEIEELQPHNKILLNLHERFLEVLKTHDNIKIISFAENEKTTFSLRYQTVVVPSDSSKINIGKFFILNKNHIYVCKPTSKESVEYQELLELIQTIYLERKNQLKTEQAKATEEFLNNIFEFSSPVEVHV